MLAAGVPVLNALEIVKKVLNNTVLEKVVEEGATRFARANRSRRR